MQRFNETAVNPSEYDIRERYLLFNRKYFNDKLPDDLVLRFASLAYKKVMGVFSFVRNPNGPVDWNACSITLDTAYDYTAAGYDGILLHEMVHAYVIMVLDNQSMEQGGHHAQFWELLEHVDSLARVDGIDMPSTESSDIKEFATGRSRRQRFCLGVYRRTGDPEGIIRFAAMLPSVFEQVVEDFKFKVSTVVGRKEKLVIPKKGNTLAKIKQVDKTATRPQPASWFFQNMATSNWYKTIDLDDLGLELYLIEASDLPFLLESKGVKFSQRFFGRNYIVSNKPNVEIEGTPVWYNTEAFGAIRRGMSNAIGKAVVRRDGVYMNGEIIHRAPKREEPKSGGGIPKTEVVESTAQGMLIAKIAKERGIPERVLVENDPNAYFGGVVLDTLTNKLVASYELRMGSHVENVLMFALSEGSESDKLYQAHLPAVEIFNMLPEPIRSKYGWALAEATLLLVQKSGTKGIYSGPRWNTIIPPLEKALHIPQGTFLANLGDELYDASPRTLWGNLRNTLTKADPERLKQVYQTLGASPFVTERGGGVPLTRIDPDAFMEDVFGGFAGNFGFPVYGGFIIYLSMLSNTEPYKTLMERSLSFNKIAQRIGISEGEAYFSKLATMLDSMGDLSEIYEKIDAVAARIRQAYMSAPPPFSYGADTERDLDTKDRLRDNYTVNGGLLLRSQFNLIERALINLKASGNVSQSDAANDALLQLNTLTYYLTNVPHADFNKRGISFDDFYSDMIGFGQYVIRAFKDKDDVFLTNDSVGKPDIRDFSVALYFLGNAFWQMPPAYRDAAEDMLARIETMAEGPPVKQSVVNEPIVIPPIEEVVGILPHPSEGRDYTRKDYHELTGPEREMVLLDAGFTRDEIGAFHSKYTKLPLHELPELYQKAFGGFKYLFGKGFIAPTREDVQVYTKPDRREKLQIKTYWDKLWTNFKPGAEIPAGQFGGDSSGGTFAFWEGVLKNRYKEELLLDQAVVRQNDRAANFPFGRPPLVEIEDDEENTINPDTSAPNGGSIDGINITPREHEVLWSFMEKDGPESSMYSNEITSYNRRVKKEEVAGVTSSLVKKGLVTKYADPEYGDYIILTDIGQRYVIAFEESLSNKPSEPVSTKPKVPEGQPVNPPPTPTSGIPEPDHLETPPSPERQVRAPKVKVADGKTYWNITIGVNEKTKKLMFVPTESAKGNNIGLVRKREAKPVASFLTYVYADELETITKKIKSGNRKSAARDLASIANAVRRYLMATVKESTPYPGLLSDKVESDFGSGLSGQKAFWRFTQGKLTSRKKLYHDVEKLKQLAGIGKPDDIEEATTTKQLNWYNVIADYALGGSREEATFDFTELEIASYVTVRKLPGLSWWKAQGKLHFANIKKCKTERGWEIDIRKNDDPIDPVYSVIETRLNDAKQEAIRMIERHDSILGDMPRYRHARDSGEQAATLLKGMPKIDNIHGIGNTPNGHPSEVSYRGLVVAMKPSVFLALADKLDESDNSRMEQLLKDGKAIASPFLKLKVPDEWFEGDFSKPAKVLDHDGRHRMKAIKTLYGDKPVEVHLFPTGENRQFRRKNIGDKALNDWILAIDSKLLSQSKASTRFVKDTIARHKAEIY